jgi:hypothetical protein
MTKKKVNHTPNIFYICRSFFVALVFLFSLLFLTSCNTIPSQQDTSYLTGTDGIQMNVAYFKPGHKFVQGEYLNLHLDVFNKGVYDNPDGFIKISGYDPASIFFNDAQKQLPALVGKKQYLPEGDSYLVRFEETSPLKVNYGSSSKTNLLISACYNYQTKAVFPVCVPSMADYMQGSAVCMPEARSLSSQGAPVAVTYVEPTVGSNMLQFMIHISNVGEGKIVRQDLLENCPLLGYGDFDEVSIRADISSLGQAQCGTGDVKLLDGEGVAICQIPISQATDYSYLTEMQITLDYGYTSSITEPIEITNPFYTGKDVN